MADSDLSDGEREALVNRIRRGCGEHMYRTGQSAGETYVPPAALKCFSAGVEWACEQSVGVGSAGMSYEDLERLAGVANTLSRGLQVKGDTQ